MNEIFTTEIVGMDLEEGRRLIARLAGQARIPELQCRIKWSEGAVVFWDNRSTQHYAVSDYAPQRRVMERATIIGDRPV